MSYETIGGLKAIRVPGRAGGPVIVLFHGFGASAADLAPLAQQLKAPKGATWIFPEGPLSIPFAPGFSGRAWFPLISEELARLAAAGRFASFADVVPPGIDEARAQAESLLAALGVAPEQITLGGFSQGSMLATDVFLRATSRYAGLVILSGTLISQNDWRVCAPQRAGSQFFQSHGREDPLLPFGNAKALEALLREAGLTGEFVSFSGGHEIPVPVLRRLEQYLER